ncbi:MAG TPA: zf-HC2 domain-containing protein [Chloroflexota bacterium]|nr:zf-HC2 domain-containing protein [Chloroflexota bacterium]
MSHEEASELLALYAVDGLSADDARAVSEHLGACAECQQEFRVLQPAVVGLAGAPAPLASPAALRERILSSAAASMAGRTAQPSRNGLTPGGTLPERGRLLRFPTRAPNWLAAAVLVVALAGGAAAGLLRDASDRAELQQQEAALTLLTSTETTADRLVPAPNAGLPPDAHGHWWHRIGVPTQVFVGELLPPLPSGQQYVVWQRIGSDWHKAGELDSRARLIVRGSDGANVSAVEISRDPAGSTQPGDVLLRFPAEPAAQ